MKLFNTKVDCFDYFINKSKSEILDFALDCMEYALRFDILKAELDRLKTLINHTERFRKDTQAELSALKSRLPVNADGDVIVIGEPQFIYFPEDGPVDVMVHAIYLRKFGPEYKFAGSSDSDFLIEMEDWARGNLSCHSTAESCRKAHAANGGGE